MALQRMYAPQFFEREWKVSGLWNSILAELIQAWMVESTDPSLAWQISPEAYPNAFDTQSNRADLLVSLLYHTDEEPWNAVDRPVITFEAKKGGGMPALPSLWQSVRTQLEAWCNLADGVGRGFPCWAIGAVGYEVKFWIFTGSIMSYNRSGSRMVPVECDRWVGPYLRWSNEWVNGDTPDEGTVYDYNSEQAATIVKYMLDHPFAMGLVHPSQPHPGKYNKEDW